MSIAERLALAPELRNTSRWEGPAESDLAEADRVEFRVRKQAVCAYLGGTALAVIKQKYGKSRSQIYRMVGRCLESRPDGSMFGFYGLVPRMTVASYKRRAAFSSESAVGRGGYAGLFLQLVSDHPHLFAFIEKHALASASQPARSLARAIHPQFLKLCARVRGAHEYPFAVSERGRPALARMIERIREQYRAASAAPDSPVLSHECGMPMTAQPSSVGLLRPYEEVENDGHNGDFYFVVKLPQANGGWVYTTPMKLWLLLIIDRASRAIVGYAYRLGSTNYPAVTVMRSFVHMLEPWRPMTLTLPGLSYKPGAGFPSGAVPGLAGCLPDMVCLDNSKANIAKLTVEGLCDSLGVTLNFARVRTAIARAFIERLNLTLETHGFRRLPGGFNPKGPRQEREQALKAAQAHPLEVHELEQVLDVMLANYNADPHESLMGRSPNEYLQLWVRSSTAPRRLAADPVALARTLTRVEYIKCLRGGADSGRSPYVELLDARYSNDVVRRMVDWIGKPIHLVADVDGDFRLLRGYLVRGTERIDLGVLKAAPPWHLTPHTLEQRKMILAAKRTGQIVPRPGEDMAQAFKSVRLREAKTRKSAANALARVGPLSCDVPVTAVPAEDARSRRRTWIKLK